MLFFIRPRGDITRYKDASDDAVGGHLTQKKNEYDSGKKISAVQSRWSTIDKEMFAL